MRIFKKGRSKGNTVQDRPNSNREAGEAAATRARLSNRDSVPDGRPRTRARQAFNVALAAVLPAILGGCATPSRGEPVSERLDPNTATTVVVLTRPVELLAQATHGSKSDPFAYIAPFETDRMGQRTLYLWVSAPQDSGPLTQPQVLCNGEPLNLEPLATPATEPGPTPASSGYVKPDAESLKIELSQLNLSHAPYDAPVPWSSQWYFRLPPEGLKCLAGAQGISLEARAPGGDAQRFTTADRKNLASLDEFTRRY